MEKDLLDNAGNLFEGIRGPKPADAQSAPRAVVRQDRAVKHGIGLAKKKVWDQSVALRLQWIDEDEAVAVSRQCQLIAVTRSVVSHLSCCNLNTKPD